MTLTAAEAAVIIGCRAETVTALARRGILPGKQVPSGDGRPARWEMDKDAVILYAISTPPRRNERSPYRPLMRRKSLARLQRDLRRLYVDVAVAVFEYDRGFYAFPEDSSGAGVARKIMNKQGE
jgi:hypothetical protein